MVMCTYKKTCMVLLKIMDNNVDYLSQRLSLYLVAFIWRFCAKTERHSWSGSKPFETMIVSLKDCFEKNKRKKSQQTINKNMNHYQASRDVMFCSEHRYTVTYLVK